MLAEKMLTQPGNFDSCWNFGPSEQNISVNDVVNLFKKFHGNIEVIYENDLNFNEAISLSLDTKKSREMLEWSPRLSIEAAVYLTVTWYRAYSEKRNMLAYSGRQILEYVKLVKTCN